VDVATPLTFSDYAAGRDPALEAALNYVPQPPLEQRLVAAAQAGGPAAVRKLLSEYRSDPAHRYANLTLHISRAAETLWNAKHPEAALMAAEYGAEQFPNHVDAWNVLAHVAEAAKRTDVARKAGARVLELEPNSRTARALMERLAWATS
jgi:tetratricopeptide (TPR) repeat protein